MEICKFCGDEFYSFIVGEWFFFQFESGYFCLKWFRINCNCSPFLCILLILILLAIPFIIICHVVVPESKHMWQLVRKRGHDNNSSTHSFWHSIFVVYSFLPWVPALLLILYFSFFLRNLLLLFFSYMAFW